MTFREFARLIDVNPLLQSLEYLPKCNLNRVGWYVAVRTEVVSTDTWERKTYYFPGIREAVSIYGEHEIDEAAAMIVYPEGVVFYLQ